jgi:hypothetical protein
LQLINAVGPAPDESSWGNLSIESRWRLSDILGALAEFGLSGKPMKRIAVTSAAVERDVATRGAALLVNAADEIPKLLSRIRMRSNAARHLQTMNEAWPGLLRLLRRQLNDEGFEWFCGRLKSHIDSAIDDGQPVTWRKRGRYGVNGAGAVAADLGVRVERLPDLVAMCGLHPRSRTTAAGRTMAAFDSREAVALRAHLDDHLSCRVVTARFGLGRERLNALREAGLVRAAGARFSVSSVRELFSRMEKLNASGSGVVANPDGMYVSLAEVLRIHVPTAATGAFFQAVLRGTFEIRLLTARSHHARDFLVHQPSVTSWVSSHSPVSEGLTVPAAAEHLGVKEEVAYHLVRVGLLRAVASQVGRRLAQVVPHAELRRFRNQVRPLVDLAKQRGIGARGAVAWAESEGLELVSGPTVDGGRQYFVNVSAGIN